MVRLQQYDASDRRQVAMVFLKTFEKGQPRTIIARKTSILFKKLVKIENTSPVTQVSTFSFRGSLNAQLQPQTIKTLSCSIFHGFRCLLITFEKQKIMFFTQLSKKFVQTEHFYIQVTILKILCALLRSPLQSHHFHLKTTRTKDFHSSYFPLTFHLPTKMFLLVNKSNSKAGGGSYRLATMRTDLNDDI